MTPAPQLSLSDALSLVPVYVQTLETEQVWSVAESGTSDLSFAHIRPQTQGSTGSRLTPHLAVDPGASRACMGVFTLPMGGCAGQ